MKKSRSTAFVRDMTSGSPLRLILLFAIPLFIGNIFQQIYSIVDTMVVGYHLGNDAIAAIGASSSMYSLIINLACGLNNGYGIVITQRFGSHDRQGLRHAIAGTMILNTVSAVVLTTLALCFMRPLMRFMNTPDAIFADTYKYIVIITSGMAATLGYNMFASILRAMGNSKSPLYFLILACGVNIVLDFLFVVTFEMGVGGAAFATVIAQAISAVICAAYVLKNYREYLPKKSDFRVPGTILSNLFSTGVALGLMSSVVDLGSVIFQRANNLLGETLIAVYAASRKILSIIMGPQMSVAIATSTFVGQNWGARKPERIKLTLRHTFVIEFAWGLVAGGIVSIIGASLIRLVTGSSDPTIIENGVLSLRTHCSMLPVLGILFCTRNSMQAMGQKVAPVLSSCIELAMKIVSATVFIPTLGFLGTCITEPIIWVMMTAFLLIVYFAKRNKLFAQLKD
ncbi:MAG: MATE family efflux transporter [Oscillospiraceae bacterium]|nr:MATE family efflux transporter [Oscillospiraceae bacterium]